jgi:quercetin dioxygenase-like cupin family protein
VRYVEYRIHDSDHYLITLDHPGDGFPLHDHAAHHYTMVVSGEVEVSDGGCTRVCKAPDLVLFDKRSPHAIRAITAGATILHIYEPGARTPYQ